MSILVEKLKGVTHDEPVVTLGDGGSSGRVHIHPWKYGENKRPRSQVYIEVGDLDERGKPLPASGLGMGYDSAVVSREDFICAVLAVFPELALRDDGR